MARIHIFTVGGFDQQNDFLNIKCVNPHVLKNECCMHLRGLNIVMCMSENMPNTGQCYRIIQSCR